MAKRPPIRVLFDTPSLCSAFLNPDGLDMALLQLARVGVIEPVITQEIVAEWARHAKAGQLDGIHHGDEDLEAFCQLVEPLLSPRMIRRVRIGRAESPLYPIVREGGLYIIQHPTGRARTETHMRGAGVLALKDYGDLHVVLAALYHGCDYLCSYNSADLPDGLKIGPVECIRPERLMALLRQGRV